MKNSTLALLPSPLLSHAMLASHKQQCVWLISLVRYSHTVETLRPVRPRLEPRSTTIISSSSGDPKTPGTAGESLITAGIPKAMEIGPEFVGGPPWSLTPISSVIAEEAEDDMACARVEPKFECADFVVGRQPAVANLNC
jgi:hypothetical protein